MFKYFIVVTVLLSMIAAGCGNKKNEETDGNGQPKEKKITRRNYSITPQNSYSNFFFDSSLMVPYFSTAQVPDSVSRRITSFYNNRNYQFAWFSSSGPTEQARGFWNMYKYYLSYEKEKVINDDSLVKLMDRYIADDDEDWSGRESKLIQVELKLTRYFISFYLSNTERGYIKRKEMEKFIPYIKNDPVTLADSVISKKHKDGKYYADVNPIYGKLKDYLAKYVAIKKNGGWPLVTVNAKQLNSKTPSAELPLLKRRLFLTGDYPAADSSLKWNDTLTAAIRSFQQRHGYKPTGTLTDQQLADMNVPVEKRIAQLLINMYRTQWLIDDPKGRYIFVNIPEYVLHVTDNGKKVFDMEVVVGKEGHNTTIFTGNLNQVVFAPYWNVPVNIVQKEIAPQIEKNPDYLKDHNMEVTGSLGNGLPAVRQLPGGDNALGKVKFLFPNSYDIYFHDTPAKSFFSKEKRAYSHGCIRLSDPVKMANYLLQNEAGWDAEKIDIAMNETTEQFVKLKNPVPVLITYYTAWTDDEGRLHFAEDIYGHDKMQVQKMFIQ